MAVSYRAPIGWPLLPVPDEAGRLQYPDLETSILQSIQVILQTRPGEQLMRPGFGAGLQDFVGKQDTTETRAAIRERARTALERWEPRIRLEAVDLADDTENPGWLRIDIRFRIRRTGEPRNLGLTLALESC